ncbi:uncharacterized protein LOC129587673 [Paramacrobiotus metropolitanus]|uniref:uncharacterized protein LOC129587673 n=1 Tax=Paramacrobiotus metropolitanus TaxID=2943436 RepID=UPI0024465440|nr:uncharacterized protein LOC129587673 [Paramacrobiotus metropolitanus]
MFKFNFYIIFVFYFACLNAYVINRDPTFGAWPNRLVPYVFNPGDYSSNDMLLIQSAMAQISSDTGGCINWQNIGILGNPLYPGQNFVIISKAGGPGAASPTCYSYPGMLAAQNGAGQYMSIQPGAGGCMQNKAQIMRLLSYLLELRPEHNKPNRDTFVTTNPSALNIAAASSGVFNRITNESAIIYNSAEFDYNSITLIDPYTYSGTGAPVITSKANFPIYNSGRLSIRDCQALAYIYGCNSANCQDVYGSNNVIFGQPVTTVPSVTVVPTVAQTGLCSPNLQINGAWNDYSRGRIYYLSGNLLYGVSSQNGQIMENGVPLTSVFPSAPNNIVSGYYQAGLTYLLDSNGNVFLYQNGNPVSQLTGGYTNIQGASAYGNTASATSNINAVGIYWVNTGRYIVVTGVQGQSAAVTLASVFSSNTAVSSDLNNYGIREMYSVTVNGQERLVFLYQPTDGRPLQYFEAAPCSTTTLVNSSNQVCLNVMNNPRPFSSTIPICSNQG